MSTQDSHSLYTGPKYRTILIDPPWSKNQGGNYGAVTHYDVMSTEEIADIPVSDLLEANAHIYLWATASTLPDALEVMKHYGGNYKSVFVWLKTKLGLGRYFRNANEFLLLGVKGKKAGNCNTQISWGIYPLQGHSHKPEEVYDIIERMSDGPYLELFARRPRHGWDAWGNEIASDIVIPGYPVPVYSDKVKS